MEVKDVWAALVEEREEELELDVREVLEIELDARLDDTEEASDDETMIVVPDDRDESETLDDKELVLDELVTLLRSLDELDTELVLLPLFAPVRASGFCCSDLLTTTAKNSTPWMNLTWTMGIL